MKKSQKNGRLKIDIVVYDNHQKVIKLNKISLDMLRKEVKMLNQKFG